MKNFSIKSKLITIVAIFLILLGTLIATIAVINSTNSLEDAEIKKLAAIEIAKSDELTNYLNDLKALLISLSEANSTRDSLIEFENGFYKLSEEININLEDMKHNIKNDLQNNFLNKVNYDVPNSSQKKNISNYLPNDISAQIAQYIFITDNKSPEGEKNKLLYNPKYSSSYMNSHKLYHKLFDNYLKNFHLYDIFMADLKGNIIYSTFKEKDFATNLKDGAYSNSGLAKVFEKALNISDDEIAFQDFSPYEPSFNKASSFISSPIFVNGEKKGVLIFQIPTSSINNIVNFNNKHREAGLGDSGECYLVGSDYKMRSNSRFIKDIDNQVVQDLNSTVSIWEIKSESTRAIFEKNETRGEGLIYDYRGIPVLSTYRKVSLFDGLGTWAIIAEMDESEALITAKKLAIQIIIVSLVCILISLLLIWLIINKIIVKPLNNFKDGLLNFFNYLNKETTEVKPLDIKANDEIGLMSNVINENISKTKEAIESDNKFIDEVSNMIEIINKGLLNKRFENKVKSENLEKLRQNMNLMLENLNSIIGNDTNKVIDVLKSFSRLDFTNYIENDNAEIPTALNNVTKLITQMLVENKTNGLTLNDSANVLLSNMQTLSSSANEAAASLEETAAALEEVTSNIANSTENVVSMVSYANKLTDSANSGQELAKETTVSMDEINNQVTSINEAITVIDQIAFQTNILSLNAAVEAATAGEAGKGFAVVAQEVRNLASRSAEAAKEIKDLVESATSKANSGKNIADKMIQGYSDLTNNISSTMELIHGVEVAAKEQRTGIEQINSAINQLDQQTQKNAQISSQTTNIAKDTQEIAKTILNDVNEKEFEGKNSIAQKKEHRTQIIENNKELNLENLAKKIEQPLIKNEKNREISSNIKNDDDDTWESF